MTDPLTPAQRAASDRVFAEEALRREHVVVAVTGAHAYGFASVDSDVDLKAVHADPTERFLGLSNQHPSVDRLELVDGVEIDYTSNELGMALSHALSGNGNMLERLLDPAPYFAGEGLDELQAILRRCVCKRVYRHYRGFAANQRKNVGTPPTVKKVLYVLRTTLTGVHALDTGRIVADLSALADSYGFPEARDLIGHKRAAEQAVVPPALAGGVDGLLDRAFSALDAAFARSTLGEVPEAAAELEAWLVRYRLARVAARA